MGRAVIEIFHNYLHDDGFIFSLGFTLKVVAGSCFLHLVCGVLIGRYLSRRPSRVRSVVELLIILPMVFPPIALGFLLLFILGKSGPIGHLLFQFLGIRVVFTGWGVMIAAFIAGLPLIVKTVQSAIQQTACSLMEASYTLGKSEWQTFFQVVLPSIKKPVVSGLSLALGRSLGEVGLTLMLGGNIVGKTNTLSLEIYNAVFCGEFERAMVLALVLGFFSAIIFMVMKKSSV